jgi:hypothetical protein
MPVVDFGTFTMSQIKAAHPAAAGALDLYGSNLRNIKFIGASDDAPILNFDDSTAGTLDNSSIRAYIDRIVVEGSGSAIPVELMGGLRNSIVTASDSAYALEGVGSVIGSTILNRTPAAAAIRVRQTREPSGLEQLHNSLYVRNSIIRGTGSEDNILTLGPAVDVDWTNVNPGGRVAFSLPPIEAPVSVGSHITTLEPGFVSATDLHLQPTSPLIDAGATAVTLGLVNLSEVTAADLGSLDAFGARRLRAGNSGGAVAQPDIGAAEYQPPSPAVSAVRVASRKVRAGGTNSVSMRVSAAANLLVLVQRVQGKRVTTIATRRVKAGVGPVVARFTLRSGRKKFAKGQYRFAISPTSIDGVAGSAVYLPFKIV